MSVQLTPDQDAVITKFLQFVDDPNQREMVIEGFPGCGKSFVTKYLIEALKNHNKVIKMLGVTGEEVTPLLTATTNKAAKVLFDFIGAPTQTIHSLLGLRVKNDLNTGETKLVPTASKADLENIKKAIIIVDEASYVDDFLLKHIRKMTFDCKILYIGDRYQLASVKSHRPPVFYDITNKGVLTTSKRFDENGSIATLAEQFRKTIDTGEWEPIIGNDSDVMVVNDRDFKYLMEQEFSSLQHKSDTARILAWTNKQVQAYNNHIRNRFTSDPKFADGEEVIVGNSFFSGNEETKGLFLPVESVVTIDGTPQEVDLTFGDPTDQEWVIPSYSLSIKEIPEFTFVMAQDYDDYYHLLKLLAKQAKEKTKHWQYYFALKDMMVDLRPNFAATAYKSQGSTYERVFIDLNDIGRCNQWEQVARMLHVAVSRASEQVIFRGQLPRKYGGA